jgi:hypothetical protein
MSMRVISRVGARELTSEELDRISGAGTHIAIQSVFPPRVDGIIPDPS